MYKPTHFKLFELVPKELYKTLSKEALWGLFDEEALRALDWLKELFPNGSITINNWKWGGRFNYSGFRTKLSSDYSERSAHSTGKAWDLKFSDYSIEEVRDTLSKVKYSPFIRRVERGTPTWLHVDVIPKKGFGKGIYLFNP